MISKGNHVNFARFVLLAVSEEAETRLPSFCVRSMYNKTIIRFGFFVISRIIKVSVRVISLSLRLRLITLTSTLIILDITKTSSNNCLLLSGQRCQTVHALTISGMRITSDTVHFEIARLLKTSKSGKHQVHLELKSYPVDQRQCVVTCLRQHVKLTVRAGHDPLWLSYSKHFKPVSRDTVSRWINNVLEKAGVNTKIFSAHSTQTAATSDAHLNDVAINTIMEAVAWSHVTY